MAKMKNLMPSIHSATTSPLHRALAAGIALAVAGCSVVPEKITPEQVASRVQSDQSQMYKDQEAISGPVTFSAALARACAMGGAGVGGESVLSCVRSQELCAAMLSDMRATANWACIDLMLVLPGPPLPLRSAPHRQRQLPVDSAFLLVAERKRPRRFCHGQFSI
jgi:hypothetical protein